MNWNEYGGIVKAANSVRAYYRLPVYHETDPVVDAWLNQKRFRCLTVLLIDAMGTSILQRHLLPDGFFRSHLAENITTVFPPTTTAATTSFRTGRMPCETGWLGWNQYFKEKDDNIILFLNRSQYGRSVYPGYSYRALPAGFITDELNAQGMKSETIWPAWGKDDNTFQNFLIRTGNASHNPENRFIYAYWDAYDTLLHHHGPSAPTAHDALVQIEADTENFAHSLDSGCGLLIIADHSQIDVESKHMNPVLDQYFLCPPALEPRTAAFYIDQKKKDEFADVFQSLYGDSYRLYTHQEVIAQHIFGYGKEADRFEEFVGDFLAVSTNNLQLVYGNKKGTKGDHAGGLREEAVIPVILYPS